MDLLWSAQPVGSAPFIVDVVPCKNDVKMALAEDESSPTSISGLREFVIRDADCLALVKADNPKRARESLNDYHARCIQQIAKRFCSAPAQLALVCARDSSSATPVALLRLESRPATKLVHLGLLAEDGRASAAARILLAACCGYLRREHRKRRVRTECSVRHEALFRSCGFRRLATQEALRFHPATGDPKRLVAMERRLSLWEDASPVLLLVALVRAGRASALATPPPSG